MAGVYLSFPFCSQKCSFCNFASGVFPHALELEYYEAVADELRGHEWTWTPETLYLGGGTPSQMDISALQELLRLIPGKPWKEATMEAAPGSLTGERIDSWRHAGITRVSLGVQSFVARELIKTGRKHTSATVISDCELLRAHGIHNFNIDLIAGLPFQTVASWHESLDVVETIGAPHVSVYMLEVDEDSRLGSQILGGGSKYGASETPADEVTAELYSLAVERLASMGILRYEISNFARPGNESAHNLKYWQREPYAGFGADAHSFDGSRRWGNAESAGEYIERWRQNRQPGNETEEAVADEERFFVGLRLSRGIVPRPDDWVRFAEPIGRFVSEGLLERSGDTLRLTSRGVLFSNEVFQEFLTA